MVLVRYILLFLCLSCEAQLPVVPFVTQNFAGDIPASLGGMAFRLRSADLVKSNTVNTWVDEVAGRTYTNNAATAPTNSWNLGVFFKSGNFLSNNIGVKPEWIWQPTQQVFIAYQAISPANYGSIVGSGSAEFLIGYSTAPNNFGNVAGGPQVKWINSYPVSGVNYAIVSVGGAAPVQAYSNGVAALTFTATGDGFSWHLLGANQQGLADTYQGYVKEIIVWTNQTAFTFSPYAGSQVSNLYFYATNQGYLP